MTARRGRDAAKAAPGTSEPPTGAPATSEAEPPDRRHASRPPQLIQIGDHQVTLPARVSVAEWGLERAGWQNPLLRAFLGCIRLLEGVLDSNYAILHCSPDRLHEIWRQVRQVGELIRTRVAPLLEAPSKLPRLQAARASARQSLALLAGTVLRDLDRHPQALATEQLVEVRKLLCVSIGKLHAFLRDTFAELMAGDPRSLYDADYFLSKRFPRDIDEAEWLYASVDRLHDYLKSLGTPWVQQISSLADSLRRQQALPSPRRWREARLFLDELQAVLTPKLREILALRGIRFDEMEILDRYAVEIPTHARTLATLYETSREAVERLKAAPAASRAAREQKVEDLLRCHAVYSRSMVALVVELDRSLRDLIAFVPIWQDALGHRRALMLRKATAEADPGEGPGGAGAADR